MRTSSDLCSLCMSRHADQQNSHIIPKFFNEGLFYRTKPRHTLLVSRDKSRIKVQDTFKEDFLLCSECEKGFSVLETYCSLRLGRIGSYGFFNHFTRFINKNFEMISCK